jgi:lysophospholipase L1-like esterase
MEIKKAIKTLFVLLITTFLTLSIALNYLFYKKAFIPLHALRLNPLELNYYSSLSSNIESDNKKNTIMYYGDSRALSWPFIKNNKFNYINRSIGNQTSIQINDRFKNHVVSHKPQVILVQMCVNDLKMIPLFPEKKEQIIQGCISNIESILQKAHNINSKVILTTVFPLGDISLARKMLGIKEQPIIGAIDIINKHIKSLKAENTLVFDSFGFLVGNERKVDSRYSHDWLHINETGYQHLNQNLKKFVNKEL